MLIRLCNSNIAWFFIKFVVNNYYPLFFMKKKTFFYRLELEKIFKLVVISYQGQFLIIYNLHLNLYIYI